MVATTRSSADGFTLIELMVTVSVLLVLLTVAGPALSALIVTQQLKNAAFDLTASLVLARSEALTRNVAVTVAPANGGWAQGWSVTDANGTVLRRQSAYPRIAMSGPASLVFSSEGRPDSTATPFALTSSEVTAANGRCVRVRLNGRPSLATGAC